MILRLSRVHAKSTLALNVSQDYMSETGHTRGWLSRYANVSAA